MKKAIIIPARLESTRLPKKVLLDLKGRTILERVFMQCSKVHGASIYIATDSKEIRDTCLSFTENIIMTKTSHRSGTERVSEAAIALSADLVVNVQGDEPFVKPELINKLFNTLEKSDSYMASAMERILNKQELIDQNNVKVIVDGENNAIYFSRLPIPFVRENSILSDQKNAAAPPFFKHIGIYAYKSTFLAKLQTLTPHYLEQAENLEQLRVVGNGFKIKMIEIIY